ncbi:DUF397 domain-containing protein [Actinokineospora auranticolor]|uniref:DUF397 domain-containing protein n=1 Tax=Actinokineospora auranticolor TaxID=155976 RepID=UPI0015E38534
MCSTSTIPTWTIPRAERGLVKPETSPGDTACVEVRFHGFETQVRDSKNPDRP